MLNRMPIGKPAAKPMSAGRMAGPKPASIDEYLAALPEPARTALSKLRSTIRSASPPEATEGISYGMPMFKYKGMLTAFAAFKDHCSLFVLSGTLLDSFRDELRGHSLAKGTIRFTPDKPLPAALVKKLVKTRVQQNERKAEAKRRKGDPASKTKR